MRLKLLFAALLMLVPVPALADVTARYSMGDKDGLVVEAGDSGNLRASIGDNFALIRRDGVDYAVMIAPDGKAKVAEFSGVMRVFADQTRSKVPAGTAKLLFQMKPGGTSSTLGFTGTVWVFTPLPDGTGRPLDPPFEALVTLDPVLAPVGDFFRRLAQSVTPILGIVVGGETNLGEVLGELCTHGTPLRIGKALALQSVEHAKIAPGRFALPGPVIAPEEFAGIALAPPPPN